MAEKRKLLAEMEKVFRKVDEGVELFEETMAKMVEANSDNQREKFQDDLKKEIKKLQRLRDQIKGWQNSNEIKDKDKLVNYRKVIEARMEQFKDIERENKTKPHSKQGLSAEEKLDPREKERTDTIEWLQSCIGRLTQQTDYFEAEIEKTTGGGGGKKAKKPDKDKTKRAEDLRNRLEKHRFHMQKLEVVMRLVNNDSLDCNDVRISLEENLTHYMDEYMEPEIMDCDWIYEDLSLGDLAEITQQLGNVTNIGTLDEADNVSETGTGSESPSASPAPPKLEDLAKELEEIVPKQRHASGENDTRALVARPQYSVSVASRSTPTTPLKLTGQLSFDAAMSSPPPPAVTPPPMAPGIPYAAAAGARPGSVTKQSSSSSSSKQATPAPPEPRPHTPVSVVSVEQTVSYTSVSEGAVGTVQQQLSVSPTAPLVTATVSQSHSPHAPSLSPVRQPTANIALNLPSLSASAESTLSSEQSLYAPPHSVASRLLMNGPESLGEDMSVLSLRAMAEQAIPPSSSSISVNLSAALPSTVAMTFGSMLTQPQTQQPQEARVPPSLGASPLGPAPHISEHQTQLQLLEAAIQRIPLPMDSEKPRQYLPRTPCQTPSYYPQVPPPMADTIEYFGRLQPETLFFVFYYMEGTKAQYLAARALKKQSWRFHKKYMMWFQRHEEPKTITDDYEQGTYIYFDYEKWAQRKKEGFTFEYRFLEDRELS